MSDAIFLTIILKISKLNIKKWTWTLIIVYRGRVELGTWHINTTYSTLYTKWKWSKRLTSTNMKICNYVSLKVQGIVWLFIIHNKYKDILEIVLLDNW